MDTSRTELLRLRWLALRTREIWLSQWPAEKRDHGKGRIHANWIIGRCIGGADVDGNVNEMRYWIGFVHGMLVQNGDATQADIDKLVRQSVTWSPATGQPAPDDQLGPTRI